MKQKKSLISGFGDRFFNYSFAGYIFLFLIIIFNLFPACATKMSLQEAKQVAVSMSQKELNTPPPPH